MFYVSERIICIEAFFNLGKKNKYTKLLNIQKLNKKQTSKIIKVSIHEQTIITDYQRVNKAIRKKIIKLYIPQIGNPHLPQDAPNQAKALCNPANFLPSSILHTFIVIVAVTDAPI